MRRDTLTSHDDAGLVDRVEVTRAGSEVIQKFTERSHELAILVRQQAGDSCCDSDLRNCLLDVGSHHQSL